MEQHVKIVAYLLIVLGALTLLGAVCLLMVGMGVGGLGGAAAENSEDAAGALFGGGVVMAVGVFVGLLAIPNIIAGRGLLNRRSWARTLAIVLSVISLLNFPIGTAIGAYSLWVLLNDETRRMFPV